MLVWLLQIVKSLNDTVMSEKVNSNLTYNQIMAICKTYYIGCNIVFSSVNRMRTGDFTFKRLVQAKSPFIFN